MRKIFAMIGKMVNTRNLILYLIKVGTNCMGGRGGLLTQLLFADDLKQFGKNQRQRNTYEPTFHTFMWKKKLHKYFNSTKS